jgi:hypothetical protein
VKPSIYPIEKTGPGFRPREWLSGCNPERQCFVPLVLVGSPFVRQEQDAGGDFAMNAVQQPYLPLRDAVLCTECNFVSVGESGKCAVCRGSALLSLSGLVSDRSEQPRKWPTVQDVKDLLGVRRRPRHRDLGYSTRY